MTSLDTMKRYEQTTVKTTSGAITVERTGRGSFATVTSGRFNGEQVFASMPSVAFEILNSQLANKVREEISHLSH